MRRVGEINVSIAKVSVLLLFMQLVYRMRFAVSLREVPWHLCSIGALSTGTSNNIKTKMAYSGNIIDRPAVPLAACTAQTL